MHVTTSHRADDVRIYERECRSLGANPQYSVFVVGPGGPSSDSPVKIVATKPNAGTRLARFTQGPIVGNRIATSLQADVWHFHDPELLPVALRLIRRGERVIWDAHEDYLNQFSATDNKSWIPKPLQPVIRSGFAMLLGAVDRGAAGVVAATTDIARTYSNPRTVVVGNEARLEDFASCQPTPHGRQALFTGHLTSAYLALEVAQAVAAIPGLILAVAGREPDAEVWTSLKAILGDRLAHLGWLDRRGLCAAMADSVVGIASYAPLPTFMAEGTSPNKLFEFAAAGLPVVATPITVAEKSVTSGGFGLVSSDFSAQGIRHAIESVVADPTSWRAMSESGRAWSQSHGNWRASEAELLRLYRDILGR